MHQFIKQTALSVGFDACGIAKATALTEDAEFMQQWLHEGKQGEMHYLERNFEKRTDPRLLVQGCKSVVVVLMNYFPQKTQPETAPKIARYAYSEIDYHTVLRTKLKKLEDIIIEKSGSESVNSLYQHSFVDSAPVLERRWAERAGLGWIGKHTQLITPGWGSYCFIGILMLNFETGYDVPEANRCGSCARCIEACPTNALNGKSIDARRCISYQTIELKKTVEIEIQPLLSGCALGCDICADVCPWNKKWAKPHIHSELKPVEEILSWEHPDWQQLTAEKFNTTFRSSAIKRAGFEKLKENIAFVTKNKEKYD
ncbi:MAG: tRNA epoxyqueuosine(34) reductase QueG [Bacteroidales bacterium]|nr:tRNA epoxyqueuosine(34) reductase QueG [Bacteroidales bacterium]